MVRKMPYLLTPEEEIRQMLLHHFVYEKNIPVEDIWVEGRLADVFPDVTHNGRFDIMVLNDKKRGKYTFRNLTIIVECKKSGGDLLWAFDQLCEYNRELGASYMVITNGKDTLIIFINPKNGRLELLSDLPKYEEIQKCSNGGLEYGHLNEDFEVVIY